MKKKSKYLRDLFERTYLKDIIERNKILNNEEVLATLLDVIASGVGALQTQASCQILLKVKEV